MSGAEEGRATAAQTATAKARELSSVVAGLNDDLVALKKNPASNRLFRASSSASHTSDESSEDASISSHEIALANGGSMRLTRRAPRASISEGMSYMKRSVTSGSRKSLLIQSMSLDGSGRNFAEADREAEEFGPIVDVQILVKGQKCPSGYQRVVQVGKSQAADLNKGNAGKGLHLCFKRGRADSGLRPITGLVIFHEGKDEFVPPGFEIVGTYVGGLFIADLSMGLGTSGRIFLCVSRGEGAPIVDLCVVHPNHRELLPEDYGVMERTPLGFSALLNRRAKTGACYLCLKRDASHLNLLQNFEATRDLSSPINLLPAGPALSAHTAPASSPSTEEEEKAQDRDGASASASSSFNSERDTARAPETECQGEQAQGEAESVDTSGWRTKVTHHDLLSSGLEQHEVVALSTLLVACYSSDIPSIVVALRALEQAVRAIQKASSLEPRPRVGISELILKTAVDAIELSVDVIFPAALKVVLAVVQQSQTGLSPCAMHFVLRAVSRCTCFFRMHSMKTYTATASNRRTHSHRYVPAPRDDSAGSLEERDKGLGGHASTGSSSNNHAETLGDSTGKGSSDAVDALLESLSCVTLEDMNFLLRCPAMIFDIIVDRAHRRAGAPTPSSQSDGNRKEGEEDGKEEAEQGGAMQSENDDSSVEAFVRSQVVTPLVDSVCGVGRAMEITEAASRRLAKHTIEDASFSRQIYEELCNPLALNTATEENALTALVWLSQASAMLLTTPLRKGRLFNAELNLKVAHMQLLREFLGCVGPAEDGFFASHVFAYQVRKFTFQAVTYNASNMKRLDLALPVLAELWKNMRQQLKIEFALVLEKLLLFVLRDKLTPPQLRRECLTHVISLVGMHPGDLVELFLNFENDPVVVNWRTFEHLVEVLCQLTDPGVYLLETDRHHHQINKEMQYEALASLVTLLRSLTDMSGTFRLMETDEDMRRRGSQRLIQVPVEVSSQVPDSEALPKSGTAATAPTIGVRARQHDRRTAGRALEHAFQLSQKGKSAGKAIKHLKSIGFMDTTPAQIASFLHLYHKELGERNVGNYLGSRSDDEFMNPVRLAFVRALPFAGKSFEQCLRLYLEKGHFFLPGEGQQVEALMDAFAAWFVEQNPDEFSREDQDMIMLLAFTTIMLNTDLHNPNVNKKKRMTQEQFLKQISLIENGDRISQEFGVRLYKSIHRKEIKFATDEEEKEVFGNPREKVIQSGPSPSARAQSGMTSSSSSSATSTASASIGGTSFSDRGSTDMSSSELSGEDPNVSVEGGGGGGSGAGAGADSASRARAATEPTITRQRANALFQRKLAASVGTMQSLIAALSSQWRCYNSNVTSEAVKVMFEIVWVHFFSVVTKILENPKVFALAAVSHALDILGHCISISLFLGMEEERKAFAMLLAKVHYLYTNDNVGSSGNVGVVKGEHLKDKWYADVMSTSCASDNVIDVINEVHHLTASMKNMITERQSREELLAIQKRFDGHFSIVEPGRRFVREGPLMKRSRNNKFRKYHFFLFSDLLVYASHRTLKSSKFHAHQTLKLHTMQVRETASLRVFEVRHPRKSFVVQASTEQIRNEWIRDIKHEIDEIYREQLSAPSPSISAMEQADAMARDREEAARNGSMTKNRALTLGDTGSGDRAVGRAVDAMSEIEDENEESDDDSIHDPKAFECDEEDEDEEEGVDEEEEEEEEEELLEEDIEDEEELDVDLGDENGIRTRTLPIDGAVNADDGDHDEDGMQIVEDGGTLSSALGIHVRKLGDRMFKSDKHRSLRRLSASSSSERALDPVDESAGDRPTMDDVQNASLDTKLEWLKSLAQSAGDPDPALLSLPSAALHQRFVVGLRFAKPILTSSHVRYIASDEQKLLMYGFFKQSTQGACSIDEPASDDWVSFSKFKVWQSLRNVPKEEAKRMFLSVLSQVAPGWSEGSAVVA
ncbi:Ankyrin repeat, PH and SEC7 domain containing protein secG [Hondaea fermentalgiana]|uniref:Ankyrin repeat, PH and SEC7 domain containing protein secG n=1 Tax=Hondaea fermentalgiana TaxID=2315210 RepID=A0A2R5GPD1_9STRA|nr:Ankyrin repeat, PH and SEC7 domain containing protein secG [Hondaea fermentalgiana]|eukprot:GBG32730.1 Ankyrin repeat, PH and SEC7 domain containing protein secG [Hondaea fermentalgiana]